MFDSEQLLCAHGRARDLGCVWMLPNLALPNHGHAKILAHYSAAHVLPLSW